MLTNLKDYGFLFSELVKRDFKKKYKGTYLGMIWSLLSPLISLLIMSLVFGSFFSEYEEHYTIYLFCGNIIFAYFSDATSGGMMTLLDNAPVFTKVKMPKYLFVLSRNASSFINFCLTLIVFFIFCIIFGINFSPAFLLLIFPLILLLFFNVGMGLILSAVYVFFRDLAYLWSIFVMLVMYLSAVFYPVSILPDWLGKFIYLNPVYVYIRFFRVIVLEGTAPSLSLALLALFYAVFALGLGAFLYRKLNDKFLYYV